MINIELVDRWDSVYPGDKYMTVCIGGNEYVDVKQCEGEFQKGKFTYIMDCDNGLDVYTDRQRCEGVRRSTKEEADEILDFAFKQFMIEEAMDEAFNKEIV